jgi:tetratricopeptide (TPR) repeat protein
MELAQIYESVEAELGSIESTGFGALAPREAWEPGRPPLQTLQVEEWRKAGMGYEDLIARGVASQEAEQYAEALSWFRRASQFEPNLADAWYHAGQVYEDQKLWQQALDAYQKANRAEDFHKVGRSNPHFRTGVIYLRLLEDPQPAEAELALKEALAKADFGSIREAAWAHARLGQLYYGRDGDPSAAESEILNALKLAPEDKWLWVILGNLYNEENRNTEAASMYERALALDPDFEGAQKRLDAVRRE